MSSMASGKSVGSFVHDVNVFIFEKHKTPTTIIGTVLILSLTIGVFYWEANAMEGVIKSRDEIRELVRQVMNGTGPVSNIPEIRGFFEKTESKDFVGSLSEGNSEEIAITATDRMVVRNITATLSWTDESDRRQIRLYENQPETFTISILDPSGSVLDSQTGSNDRNAMGSLESSISLDDAQLVDYIGKGDFTVVVTLESSGDYTPRIGVGFRSLPDGQNDYSLRIEKVFYDGSGE